MFSSTFSTIFMRQLNPRRLREPPRNIFIISTNNFHLNSKYSNYGKKLSIWFREQSVQVTKACAKQFEFIAAQRIRRSLQLFHLYTKIWDEIALKEFLKSWRRRLGRNTKEFLFGSIGVTMFNWDQERITDNELYSYSREIEGIHRLRDTSVICKKCHLRLVIDQKQPNVKYCTCHGTKNSFANVNPDCEWKPFIEREDMLIWRREEPNSGGLYAYKVFGTFSDVSAEEFLQVQVDVDYRKEWDPTAKELRIIDTDPMSVSAQDHRTDVVYWEMIWPRLFSNRDYVYQRRWVLDEEQGIVVIVSKVADHPDVPVRPDTYRVQSYWSYMVIKPSTKFDEPGIEFGLTYFDDPGVNIPSAVTAWVAMSGLPDFLIRMRQAAKEYKKYICSKEEILINESNDLQSDEKINGQVSINVESNQLSKSVDEETIDSLSTCDDENSVDESLNKIDNSIDKNTIAIQADNSNININNNNNNNSKDKDALDEQTAEKEHSYLRYFFLTRLFA